MGDHKPSISHLESAKNKVNSSPKKNCDDDIRNKIRIYKKRGVDSIKNEMEFIKINLGLVSD